MPQTNKLLPELEFVNSQGDKVTLSESLVSIEVVDGGIFATLDKHLREEIGSIKKVLQSYDYVKASDMKELVEVNLSSNYCYHEIYYEHDVIVLNIVTGEGKIAY